MKDLPRVLLLTKEIPQSIYAGCQQLYRVFQNYPPDRLLVLGPKPDPAGKPLPCRYEEFVPKIERWVNTRLHKWVNLANAFGLVPDESESRVARLVGEFCPDVVLTVMDQFSFYKTAWRYSRNRRVPLVTLTMDNPMHFQKTVRWGKPIQGAAVRRFYNDATLSLGVSKEMAFWIEESFGKKTEVLYFGPPDGLKPRTADTNRVLRRPPHLTVGFAGSLHFYGKELSRLMPAFEKTGTRMIFYGQSTAELPASPNLENRGLFPIEKLWSQLQEECDALLLPYPGSGWLENVFRTHFPTKLSEYLWQGMPIIVTGPKYATGLRWAQEHREACLALVEPKIEEFADHLTQLKLNADLRMRRGVAAANLARVHFDPQVIRNQFLKYLSDASKGSKYPGRGI